VRVEIPFIILLYSIAEMSVRDDRNELDGKHYTPSISINLNR
jgi:hypothetical protein